MGLGWIGAEGPHQHAYCIPSGLTQLLGEGEVILVHDSRHNVALLACREVLYSLQGSGAVFQQRGQAHTVGLRRQFNTIQNTLHENVNSQINQGKTDWDLFHQFLKMAKKTLPGPGLEPETSGLPYKRCPI